MKATHRRIVVVTGLSGAGKTIFLRALEDAGFYCVDNIPVKLVSSLVDLSDRTDQIRLLGLGIDIRDKNVHESFSEIEPELRRSSRSFELVFLEADDDVLARRFSETRRPHPLDSEAGGIRKAVAMERKRLQRLRDSADRVLDTSSLTPHELRDFALSLYGQAGDVRGLDVRLVSFGFKYGPPVDANLVVDIRFLPNPHFVPHLKPMTGLVSPVANFVLKNETTQRFLRRYTGLLRFLLPHYIAEGKSSLTVAVGCTGGRHRSPAVVEQLRKRLDGMQGITLSVIHRELEGEPREERP